MNTFFVSLTLTALVACVVVQQGNAKAVDHTQTSGAAPQQPSHASQKLQQPNHGTQKVHAPPPAAASHGANTQEQHAHPEKKTKEMKPAAATKPDATHNTHQHVKPEPEHGHDAKHATQHVKPEHGHDAKNATQHVKPEHGHDAKHATQHVKPEHNVDQKHATQHVKPENEIGHDAKHATQHVKPEHGHDAKHATQHVKPEQHAVGHDAKHATQHVKPEHGHDVKHATQHVKPEHEIGHDAKHATQHVKPEHEIGHDAKHATQHVKPEHEIGHNAKYATQHVKPEQHAVGHEAEQETQLVKPEHVKLEHEVKQQDTKPEANSETAGAEHAAKPAEEHSMFEAEDEPAGFKRVAQHPINVWASEPDPDDENEGARESVPDAPELKATAEDESEDLDEDEEAKPTNEEEAATPVGDYNVERVAKKAAGNVYGWVWAQKAKEANKGAMKNKVEAHNNLSKQTANNSANEKDGDSEPSFGGFDDESNDISASAFHGTDDWGVDDEDVSGSAMDFSEMHDEPIYKHHTDNFMRNHAQPVMAY